MSDPLPPTAPDPAAPPRPLRALNQVAAFHYVTAPNAPTYRAILQAFYEARQHYVVELRPAELLDRISAAGLFVDLSAEGGLDYHLDQLVRWGNLAPSHDLGAVGRLEDFYRRRLLYRLTAVGEAAHRAVLEVEATVGRSGSLQTAMLLKILGALQSLGASARPLPDPAGLAGALHDLHSAFDTLTEEANRFIGELDRSSSSKRMEEESFILYKQALLGYIGRFVEELRRLADAIRAEVEAVEALGPRGLLEAAAAAADLPPRLGEADPVAVWLAEQLARWDGVRAWFLGDGRAAPIVTRLAEVAVDALVGLTRTLGRLNERRSRPVDRAADFRTLARWFSGLPDDRAAHRLWHAAFGLGCARHFHLADEDAELALPSASWWEAQPVEIPVRLRTRGSTSGAGRPAAAPDHALTRQWLAQKRRRERAQVDEAVRRFAGRGPLDFAALARLEPGEFELLLALLDQALGAPRGPDGTRSARTADGQLLVLLRPPAPGDLALVGLETAGGTLRCRNFRIEVRDELQAGAARAGGER